MESIQRKRIEKLGFKKAPVLNEDGAEAYQYDVFVVYFLTNGQVSPRTTIDGYYPFRGIDTMKDLQDLMFMYYGEKRYNELFGHLPAEIVSETYTEQALKDAFDDGFQTSDPNHPDHGLTSDEWFKRKYSK